MVPKHLPDFSKTLLKARGAQAGDKDNAEVPPLNINMQILNEEVVTTSFI